MTLSASLAIYALLSNAGILQFGMHIVLIYITQCGGSRPEEDVEG
jgi:hypothetical protein